MNLVELITQAEPLLQSGQNEPVVALYRAWLAENPGDPQTHFALYNLGVVLLNMQELTGARQAFEESIRLQPDFYAPYINLGNILERLEGPTAAANCWRTLTDRLPMVTGENIGYKTAAFKQIARVLNMAEAEAVLRQSLEIDPYQHEVIEHWINWRQVQCIWPVIVPFERCDRTHLMKGFAPLSLGVYTDDPLFQLANAAMYHRSEIGQPRPVYLDAHAALKRAPSARPRIGYLSSDLRIHAIGYLMAEIFELHDRHKVEIFVYAMGIQTDDAIKQRIQGAVEHWCDLHHLTDVQAAERIQADEIEILVDVNGYTHSARTKMLAMRPAPVIVNWLGYPGTMGSPYHHYLISDGFIIPPELEFCYSEKVLRLPCYQPNDRKRWVVEHRPDRSEAGLPEGVMVYGCFNGVKKITAVTWELWMRVLERVPASILWLLYENDSARDRLVAMAAQRGIAPERILFAPRKPNQEHMARYPLVDLMLDTTPYGAHTTASDALWMGVPILTMAGLSFAARVCGSLVRAAGLSELICSTPDEFVARAVELGTNRSLLESYRARLRANRDTCELFNTPLLVERLEDLYFEMHRSFREDRLPRPDLANLEVYQEVGIELDTHGVWFGSVERLAFAYLEKLAARDRLAMLPEDARLWSDVMRARFASPPEPIWLDAVGTLRQAGRVSPTVPQPQAVGALAPAPMAAPPSEPSRLDAVCALDAANDLDGLIAQVTGDMNNPTAWMLVTAQALAMGRVRVAYVIGMLLANAGYGHVVISVALGMGGVVFHNPMEEARGSQDLVAQMDALSEEQRHTLVVQVIDPVLEAMRGLGGEAVERFKMVLNQAKDNMGSIQPHPAWNV
ncbi:MAG: hypothetical protein H7834_15570 [Magnetococcus sp. YQC-9]